MARIGASTHAATLHSVKGGIYLRKSEPPRPSRIVSLDGRLKSGGDYMPANSRQCRLYASRFFTLAKNARSPEARQIFAEMADTVESIGRRSGIRSNAINFRNGAWRA